MSAGGSGMVDQNLSSKVEIYLGCRHLPKMDYFSNTDPIIHLYLKDFRSPVEVLLGTTESVRNAHNPDFDTSTTRRRRRRRRPPTAPTDAAFAAFEVEYFFEENQYLIARVFDTDEERRIYNVNGRNFIGTAEFTIGDIVIAKSREIGTTIRNAKGVAVKNFTGIQSAKVVARAEEVNGVNEIVHFTVRPAPPLLALLFGGRVIRGPPRVQISGRDLDAKGGCCSLTSPFLEIFKRRPVAEDDEVDCWQKVYTSGVVFGSRNPRFESFHVRRHALCMCEPKREILFKVFHRRAIQSALLIGQGKTCLKQIEQMVEQHEDAMNALNKAKGKLNLRGMMLSLIHPDIRKAKGRKYKNSGVLIFHKIKITQEPSFLEYIQGGLNLKLIVAIDFTASNGDPTDVTSHHYVDPTRNTMNKYEKAIQSIGSIVVPYDSDQMISLWGFGASLFDTGQCSNKFSLTFQEESDEVHGVEGMLDAYRNALSRIELSGPTRFGEVLAAATQIASTPFTQSTQHYSILVILTDGVVNDMEATIYRIVKASVKPISIIIIGIGDADFGDMNVLDADSGGLLSKKLSAARDIVQFVPMNKFRDADMGRLAAEVLSEIPGQLLSFMKTNRIRPMMGGRRKVDPSAGGPVSKAGGIIGASLRIRHSMSSSNPPPLPGQLLSEKYEANDDEIDEENDDDDDDDDDGD